MTGAPGYDFFNLREIVQSILQHPMDGRTWLAHGLGMVKTYFGKTGRLHVWDWDALRTDGVRSVHTHPWGLHSTIINGTMFNQRFIPVGERGYPVGEPWKVRTIECGVGGCVASEDRDAWLYSRPWELYNVGDSYSQLASEVHDSKPTKGCVTVVRRTKQPGFNQADVYWRDGPFVNAEPRPATEEEVRKACAVALENWE